MRQRKEAGKPGTADCAAHVEGARRRAEVRSIDDKAHQPGQVEHVASKNGTLELLD